MLYHIRAGSVPMLIRKTAQKLCGEFYEMERTDYFRMVNKDQKFRKPMKQDAFVRKNWDKYVELAVETLSEMLTVKNLHEDQKELIYQALIEYNMGQSITVPGPSLRVFQ